MNSTLLGNQLLDRLSSPQYEELLSRFKRMHLESGQLIYQSRAKIDYSYFPIRGTLSAVVVLSDGKMIEVATVGKEGGVGLPAFMEAQTSPHRVFCQIPGEVLRVELDVLRKAALQDGFLRSMLFRYFSAYLFQISQSVACNGTHCLSERCCRWLLMTHDRVDREEIELTHEFLAAMLGVRRSSVTEALQELKRRGMIDYGRGTIKVLSREALEEESCECYRAVTEEYERLLG